jgi:hypothetical protein
MSGIQNHLTITFPIKSPADAKAIAEELPPLMADFARVQDAIGTVHYSRFLPWNDKSLIFLADIDGDVEKLYGDFAKSATPVFNAISNMWGILLRRQWPATRMRSYNGQSTTPASLS